MQFTSANIMPDSFSGALFAVEGINDAVVILNGPTGCKFYHSAISDYQYPRDISFDPLNYPEIYYFGQPRIPTTFLDGYDYVYGSSEKLKKLLRKVGERGYKLITVVNSPGAALIGDDLESFLGSEVSGIPCVAIESTGFSGYFATGFQNAIIKILDKLDIKREERKFRSVNLLGISIFHKHYGGSIREIKRLLSLCGIDVITTLCAGDSLRDIMELARAEYNVLLYPEYGRELAQWLERRFGMSCLMPAGGPPLGFDATQAFIITVAEALDCNPAPALEEIEKARAQSFLYLSRFNSISGLPCGATFSVKADPSLALGLTMFLNSYLGMLPAAIEITENEGADCAVNLKAYLERAGFLKALSRPVNSTAADIVLADGNTLAQLRVNEQLKFAGIEIALPSVGYLDIVEKSLFGISGTLMLIEQVVNGLRFIYT